MKDWHNCYDEKWTGITPESFSHPAKFSSALIRRIYEHALEQNWIKPGDIVVDPFGGIALGSRDALRLGINWVGCELEQRFVDMGAGCTCTGISKPDWVRLYGRTLPAWLRANYKDGRHWCPACLAGINKVEEAAVRPLPYSSHKRRARIAEIIKHRTKDLKELGRKVKLLEPLPLPGLEIPSTNQASFLSKSALAYVRNSGIIPSTVSHPYTGNIELFSRYAKNGARAVLVQGDSRNLVKIVREAVSGLISSPPYAGARIPQGGQNYMDNMRRPTSSGRYGATEGQLGDMAEGDVGAVIGSPPYADGCKHEGGADTTPANFNGAGQSVYGVEGSYGPTQGQLTLLPTGDIDAVIGSPPFAGNSGGRGEASRNGIDSALFERHSGGMTGGLESGGKQNLGNLPVRGFDGVITSPPYGGSLRNQSNGTIELLREHISKEQDPDSPGAIPTCGYGHTPGQLANLPEGSSDAVISSPPYTESQSGGTAIFDQLEETHRRTLTEASRRGGYRSSEQGATEGQLAALPAGNPAAVIGSPPYLESLDRGTVDRQDRVAHARANGISNAEHISPIDMEQAGKRDQDYGSTPGQVGKMKEGDFGAVIGSPPFAGSVGSDDPERRGGLFADERRRTDRNLTGTYGNTPGQLGVMVEGVLGSPPYGAGTVNGRNGIDPTKFDRYGQNSQAVTMNGYGQTPGQLNSESSESGETFWSAAKIIVEQSYQILRPGGVSIWVCKDFARDWERVEFCRQWRLLCEAVGFVHEETFRALLVKDKGRQQTIDGDVVELKVERKSFFRRNYESKPGAVRIDWECVICMRKPL